VTKGYADDHGLRVGSALRLSAPTGSPAVTVRVARIADTSALILGDVLVDGSALRRAFGLSQVDFALVGFRPGASPAATERAIDAVVRARYPQVEALTVAAFKDQQGGQVTQLLGLIYALLALSVLVSLFGIVNTLVLSITERIRELGMLRAIGTSRRQVRRMVRYESVITALIGGTIGLVVGILLAVLVGSSLDGFALTIPVASLVVVLVLAGLAGVLAAVLPARRAARIDVLRALAHE
jgi:putative ABC transport system permease protein